MRKFVERMLGNSFWFHIVYLGFALMAFNGLTARTRGLSMAAYVVVFLGACILLYRVFHFKRYIGTRGVWFLLLFSVSYCISSLLTREYGILENVQALAWTVLQFFVLYVYDRERPVEKDKRDIRIICWFFIIYNFLMAVVALVMLFMDYKFAYLRQDVYVNLGFWWGRLWGLYSEVNDGAALSLISLIMAVGLWKRTRKALRPFLAVHIVLQLTYIAFTDSRTGLVAMALTFAVLTFLIYIHIGKPVNKTAPRTILAILLAVIVAIGSVAMVKEIQSAGNQIKVLQKEAEEQTETATEGTESEKNETTSSQKKSSDASSKTSNEKILGRTGDELTEDISNQRFDIWKSGLEIWRTSPIFGISFRNYVPYAKENLPDTYIVNNNTIDYEALHNVFMDVLVSQGLVGLVLFLGFIVSVLVLIFRYYFKAKSEDYWYYTFLGACILPLAISAAFMSDILYINSPETVLFWMFLGYLIHAITCDAAQEIPQPALEEG